MDGDNQVKYIVVNEDGMKMPVTHSDEEGAIAFKFLLNPTKIADLDELYDALEINRDTNVKYVVICNPCNQSTPADMTLQ